MGEWAESLRDGFASTRDGEAVRRGAIQLITYHKAKGLQWDCVVLPFLCRSVRNRSPEYPRLVPLGPAEVPVVVFGGGELGEGREIVLRRGEEQEMQRLLYVAMTRARQTLVLVDDRQVFERRAGSFFPPAAPHKRAWLRGGWQGPRPPPVPGDGKIWPPRAARRDFR